MILGSGATTGRIFAFGALMIKTEFYQRPREFLVRNQFQNRTRNHNLAGSRHRYRYLRSLLWRWASTRTLAVDRPELGDKREPHTRVLDKPVDMQVCRNNNFVPSWFGCNTTNRLPNLHRSVFYETFRFLSIKKRDH